MHAVAFAGLLALQGLWIGEIDLGGRRTLVKVDLDTSTIELPGPATLPLKNVRVDPPRVHFELDVESTTLSFDAQLEGGVLGDARGGISLVPTARVDGKWLERLYGVYEAGPRHFIWVGRFEELGADLAFFDSAGGRLGVLHPTSQRSFFSGPSMMTPLLPIDVRIDFDEGGLTFRQSGQPAVTARRVALKEERVSFRNGDVTLAGRVTLPRGKGPHPAVVLLHGSGPEDRDFLGLWAGFFARQGLAVLSYDKRGVRESTGDWKNAGIEELAGDAAAGLDLLRKRSDIDSKRIGLFGISQGGWLAPLVATRAKDVAFIILHAGSALPVGTNGLLYVESELRAYGFDDAEIQRALAYYRLNDQVTRTGEGWDELQAAYKEARARNVEWLLEEPQPKDSWFRVMYRKMMDFDPAPLWKDVRAPLLAFFGELDWNVPAAPNRDALRQALRSHDDHLLVVLPKANHLFLEARTGVRTEYPTLSHFVPGYFDGMAGWLVNRKLSGARR